MIRLFINGTAASAGGGLTYLRNVLPQLAQRSDVETTVLLSAELSKEFAQLRNISSVESPESLSALRRFIYEQTALSGLIRKSGAQVLISAGNLALWKSPVPQILLSRNSLYTSSDFLHDVRARGDYAIWIDTLIKGWLARQSINWADVTVAPSAAFARELRSWSGGKIAAIHHGFDRDSFTSDPSPLPADVQAHLADGKDSLRLLFVSHYNYYRNFETLLRAIPVLSRRLKNKKPKLYLTCRLSPRANPGNYRTDDASSLLSDLRDRCDIVELGSIPYPSLHHLYRACHIYVTPAYAESFAHPLVEAMSSGLPVVASNLAVHREICGSAARYFPAFSAEELAGAVASICENPKLVAELSQAGLDRSKHFSWCEHVDHLLNLARELACSTGINEVSCKGTL
jgi:glycosyltransferase involved in cell wall biosynthesis